MTKISTTRLADCSTMHTAQTIRVEVARFAESLVKIGVQSVKVWCSWSVDLPDDSPFQNPKGIIPPDRILDFFDTAVRNGAWSYGDGFSRAAIEAIDESFCFFLGNDKDVNLDTEMRDLLDATRSAWISAGYEVFEGIGNNCIRIHPPELGVAPDGK